MHPSRHCNVLDDDGKIHGAQFGLEAHDGCCGDISNEGELELHLLQEVRMNAAHLDICLSRKVLVGPDGRYQWRIASQAQLRQRYLSLKKMRCRDARVTMNGRFLFSNSFCIDFEVVFRMVVTR